MTGYVYRIDRLRTTDGPGLRTTVALKGCPLRCGWCDSPETLSMQPELIYKPDHCIKCLACLDGCQLHAIGHRDGEPVVDQHGCRWCGDCADACPTDARVHAGSLMTESRVFDAIEQDRERCSASGGGVTFSGGEPLMQPEFLLRLLDGCRSRGIHTAVATCGHAARDVVGQVADRTDLVLYDIKHLDDETHRTHTGVTNRIILENLAMLAERGASLVVRLALIPGVNDDDGHLRRVGEYLGERGLTRVEILPYHTPGSGTFLSLGRAYAPPSFAVPAAEAVARALRTLSACGLQASTVGALANEAKR